jgi:hypothetical protein
MNERDLGLRRVAERMVRRRAASAVREPSVALWDADTFGLERVPQYRRAASQRQHAVLERCAAQLLAESWFIEVCGITFCARMAARAEQLEERRLYALIGADEATHATWLEPWLERAPDAAGPFERFIEALVDAGDRGSLAYLLQIVLEGFGIVHYASLSESCRDPRLAEVLTRIARDEALHHAGGLASFRADALGAPERRYLAEACVTFLSMMRSGPQGVVGALDRELGFTGHDEVQQTFVALDAQSHTASRLVKLRTLMNQPGMSWLLEELDRKGLFVPPTAQQYAEIYFAAR